MIYRTMSIPLRRAALVGHPVLVQGPRGGGKTTLLRNAFPAHAYISLEDPAARAMARRDARAFWGRLRAPTIVDDIHRVPSLIEELEGPRPLILASSLRLRTPFETFELHSPTRAELEGRAPLPLEMLGRFEPVRAEARRQTGVAWTAGRTWLDRDVRALVNVHDLDRFEEFVELAKSRSGEVLDQQALAKECGVSHRTVVRWLEVLETCFQVLRLPASDLDFGRRLTRSPKLHFAESASLESQAVWEIYRNARHSGMVPELSYWRDSNGLEIPLVIQTETAPVMPAGISEEPNPGDVARLRRWMELAGVRQGAFIAARGGQLPRKGVLSYSVGEL